MRLGNKILENLRSGISLSSLDIDVQERVVNGETVHLYKCNDCGEIFNKNNLVDIKLDKADYYGVAGDFPNREYEMVSACPNCNSIELEDIGTFELEDFIDYELFEGSQWKQIYGKRAPAMDTRKYQGNIIRKLIPLLRKYGIEISAYPNPDQPGYQVYSAYGSDKGRIDFIFISGYKPTENYRNGKYDMTVKIQNNGNEEIAGVINLTNSNYVEEAFELITMTLENMGLLPDDIETDIKEEPEEVDNDLNALYNFKQSLSEQEIKNIEVD